MSFLSEAVGPLRPSRRWYAVSAATALLSLVAGAALLLLPGRLGGSVGPSMPAGLSVPISFTGDDRAGRMVWISGAGSSVPAVTCEPTAFDGREPDGWHSRSTAEDNLVRSAGGREWRGTLLIQAEPPGQYAVRCDLTPAQPDVELSIGEPPWFFGARSRAATQLGAIGLGLAGVLAGGVLAIVVTARRSAHRRRLSSQP
ncbi:hypothetical protein [Micromonospora sp. NPDC047074]|uniref:hypothetical protein n=1 Tax=Micromonospora sp. NPDC047074 TaxID=3154339 RepID=UPI0033C05377